MSQFGYFYGSTGPASPRRCWIRPSGPFRTMLPATYNPDDPIGVRRDTLVDARISLESALQTLRKMHVMLDVLADDVEGIWNPAEFQAFRDMQSDVSTLVNCVESKLDAIDEEMADIPAPKYDE